MIFVVDKISVVRLWMNVDEWKDEQLYFSASFLLTIVFALCILTKWIPIVLTGISFLVACWYAPSAFKKKGG